MLIRMRRILIIVSALVAISFKSSGQHENTLYSLSNVPQSVYINPATSPNYNFSLGLPGISSTYFSFANSGFSYNDIFRKRDNNGLWINLNDFYLGLKAKNHTKISLSSDIFSLGFKANSRMHVTFNITEKVNTRLMLPKGIFWAINGNAPEVTGNTIQMGPRINAMHYREYALGSTYTVNKKLTVGVRGKLLFGKSNIHTEKSDLTLSTSSEAYQLTLSGNMLVNTSGLNKYFDDEGQDSEKLLKEYVLNKNNKGFAIDLGGSYKLMDRLTVSASILDLGSIKWKYDVKNHELNNVSYTFDGFTLKDDEDIDAIGDTLEAQFKFNESDRSYKTSLPTKFYVGGNYLLFKNFHANLLFSGEIYQKNFSPSISAGMTKDFGRTLSLSLSYTAANRSANQIGSGIAIKLWPAQIYFVSDNIIGAALMPKSTKDFNARLGMNLVFGRKPTEDKQPYK